MTRSRTIPREVLGDLTYCDEADGFKRLGEGATDKRRWTVSTEVFFSDPDGLLWGAWFERPATECQDGMDFEEDVDCYPVEPVMVTTYRKVK